MQFLKLMLKMNLHARYGFVTTTNHELAFFCKNFSSKQFLK